MEFKVNDYISLRLENDVTNIYINNKLFNQCKLLLLDIPVGKITPTEEVQSVDEMLEQQDISIEEVENIRLKIPADVIFWGHCSNLQLWAEYDYNTRLLHSNLAFPLLKKLAEIGDIKALQKFREEIAERLDSGCFSVVQYLFLNSFTENLTREELFNSLLAYDEASAILAIEKLLDNKFLPMRDNYKLFDTEYIENKYGYSKVYDNFFIFEDKKITGLRITGYQFSKKIPALLINFSKLKSLYLFINGINQIFPTQITMLKPLEELEVIFGDLTAIKEISDSITNLQNLKKFALRNTSLRQLPNFIVKLKSLETLIIQDSCLNSLPDEFSDLRSLQKLELNFPIRRLPASFESLENLERLKIQSRFLTDQSRRILDSMNLKLKKTNTNFLVFEKIV